MGIKGFFGRLKSATGYDVVRFAVALILLVSAALKCHQLATEPILEKGWLDSRPLLIFAVEFELLLGIWLTAGVLPMLSWATVVVCFGLFACISLGKALAGYETCGCFGAVHVPPIYTGILDTVVLASLVRWHPTGQESLLSSFRQVLSMRAVTVLVVWLMIGAPAALAMGGYRPTLFSDNGDLVGNGKTVLLKPETWIGKRFPLFDYIDIGEKLKDGDWLMLLYHHDCPKCQEAIAELTRNKQSVPLVCVEVPPYGSNGKSAVGYTAARLRADRDWFVATPATLRITGGRVSE